MKYRRTAELLYNTPWAIMPDKFQAIEEFVRLKATGFEAASNTNSKGRFRINRYGSIGVIPVYGVIAHRMNMVDDISSPGGTSTELLGKQIKNAIDDPFIKTIVLDIDSPGGSVSGVPEVAEIIYQAREHKTIIAQANSLAASAAYWIGCAAHKFYVTPSGMAGSIGVVMAHTDISKFEQKRGIKTTLISAGKHKVEGNAFEPLNDEAHMFLQNQVDSCYDMFVTAISKYRRVSKDTVIKQYGEGRTLTAKQATRLAMVDGISTMDETLRDYSKKTSNNRRAATGLHSRLMAEIDLLELGGHQYQQNISKKVH